MARVQAGVRFGGDGGAGKGPGSQNSAMNHASTFWRAQGVLRRKVRLDFTDGSNWKQRIGIRMAISLQPCRWTNWLMMLSKVTPCNGSRGCEAGAVMSGFPFERRVGGGELGDDGGEAVRGGGAGGGELRLQLVHQGHQLRPFGHDPALFGGTHFVVRCPRQGRGWNGKSV